MKIISLIKFINPLVWMAISICFGKYINKKLIEIFDKSRLKYVFLIFPVYLLTTLGSLFLGVTLAAIFENIFISYGIASIIVIFVGIPMFMSFHLSAFLIFQAYFELFAKLKIPLADAGVWYCSKCVEAYRPGKRFNLFW